VPAAVHLVDDVHAVVLPVRACDAEEEREPAPETEPALPGELPLEEELVPLTPEIVTLLLAHAVEKDLDRFAGARR
jgi:hypothetical protein